MYLAPTDTVEFVDAMSALASGVVVVTTRVADRPWGMTVTAFASVGVDPPTVLVSLAASSVSARTIDTTGAFGVSVLARGQLGVAAYAGASGETKFLDTLIEPAERASSSPAIAGALAHLDCDVTEVVEAADHVVYFGRVQRARRDGSGDPLLYHGRRFRSLLPITERNLRWTAS